MKITDGKYNPLEGLAGFEAGTGLGGIQKGSLADVYNEQGIRAEMEQRGMEYANAHISEWLKAGEELVFPERLEAWKNRVETSAKGSIHGLDISKAIEIMKMLETDVDVKDVVETFKTQDHCGGLTDKLVLAFSKRGPEYMEQFMKTVGIELTPKFKEKIEAIKTENRQYAKNELARNRAEKEEKTGELEKTNQQLAELSAENQGKDTNEFIQE